MILIYKNQIAKAYLYLKNPGIEYTITDIQGYLNEDELSTMQMLYRSLIQINSAEDICRFVEMVSEFIGSMNRNKLTTRWEGYQNDEWEWSSDPSKWSLKMRNVSEMIERINPDTIVDLAGNMGWYGTYWHKNLKYALIVDYDYNCIDPGSLHCILFLIKNKKSDCLNRLFIALSFAVISLTIKKKVFR